MFNEIASKTAPKKAKKKNKNKTKNPQAYAVFIFYII